MQLSRSTLFLSAFFSAEITSAQMLFQNDLGPGTVVSHVDILPGGDVILAGRRDGHLFLARSDQQGDTLWTRTYPDLGPSHELRLTEDGTISVIASGIQQFDALSGDHLGSLGGAWGHWYSGTDSLTRITGQTLTHGQVDGDVAWEVSAPSWPNGNSVSFDKVMRTSAGMFVILGRHHLTYPSFPYSATNIWLGMYTPAGVLIDSTSYEGQATMMVYDIHRTFDGGFLAYAQTGTMTPLWVRGTASAEISAELSWFNGDNGDTDLCCLELSSSVLRPDGTIVSVGNATIWQNPEERDYAIVEIDPGGVVRCLRFLSSEMNHDIIYYDDIALADDGSTFMSGPPGQWIGLAGSCGYQTGISEYSSVVEVKAHPQPSTGSFRLEGLPVGAVCKAIVFDARGKCIAEISLAREPIVDLTNQPAGIYHARIVGEQGQQWNVTLVRMD